MTIKLEKKLIRDESLKKRDRLQNNKIENLIVNKLFKNNLFLKSSRIFLTMSIGSEINTNKIIAEAQFLGKKIFIPKLIPEERIMKPVEINSSKLIRGKFGILEPEKFQKEIETPDLVIVPGTAFSRKGYRIGYGGGYFDRFLAQNNIPSLSLSYDDLVFDQLPIENFDKPVDQIITEKTIYIRK